MANLLGFKKFDQEPIHYEEFDSVTREDGFRVYQTPVGEFPSMTTILGILDDGGIDEWKARVGEEEAHRIASEAAERGNSLHDLNEHYLQNTLTRDYLRGKPGTVLFHRVKKYLDEIDVVNAIEIPLYNEELRYAGRVDCVAKLGGTQYVIDHKNSRRPINTKYQYARRKLFTYMLQCTGYAICLEQMFGITVEKGMLIVGNHETSTADKFPFKIDDFLRKELALVVKAYYNETSIKDSAFFKL